MIPVERPASHEMLRSIGDTMRTLGNIVRREIATRFTGDALGYAWTYVMPLSSIGFIYLAFAYFGRVLPFDTDRLSFILSGMLPYLAFRFTVNAVVRARAMAQPLRVFAGVTPGLAYTAAALVEFYNGLLLFAVLMLLNFLAFGNLEIDDPLLALTGFSLAWALGATFAYAALGFARFAEILVRSINVVLRPLFFISGIFYTANELPGGVLDVLRYNPLLDAVELTRTGLFLSYTSRSAGIAYPLVCVLALLATGLVLHRAPPRKIAETLA